MRNLIIRKPDNVLVTDGPKGCTGSRVHLRRISSRPVRSEELISEAPTGLQGKPLACEILPWSGPPDAVAGRWKREGANIAGEID